jgi:hypothetical protein
MNGLNERAWDTFVGQCLIAANVFLGIGLAVSPSVAQAQTKVQAKAPVASQALSLGSQLCLAYQFHVGCSIAC